MTDEIEKVSKYLRQPIIRERFAEIVGAQNAGAYVASALLAVASSDKLLECTPESVYVSAMRAATLHLSVDPSTGQAYLVPFKGKATLIVGYKGLHDMAVRTGKYRFINVGPIFESEIVVEDRISGFLTIQGTKTSTKKIGWIGSFQMYSGYGKSIYMTIDEIHAHAVKYSRNYAFKDSAWKTDTEAMEKKTVLRLLLRRWGYLDPADIATLEHIENGEPEAESEPNPSGAIDVVPSDPAVPEAPVEKKSEAQLLFEIGAGEKPLPESPINKALREYGELYSHAKEIGIAVDELPLLPENVTIDQVRAQHRQLEAMCNAAESQAKQPGEE